jgi:ankyrin repeat protein
MPTTLRQLIEAIAASDDAAVDALLHGSPQLASEALAHGATRAEPRAHFIGPLRCYAYEGDTALHFAAAAYRPQLIPRLVAGGADVGARNRLGATALHYAAVGNPQSPRWSPQAQAAAIAALIAAGADVNAIDGNGTTPLHRAVRTRCAAAVGALLAGGADATLTTRNGSSPAKLASVTSGRGGSGSPEAKREQAEIRQLLEGR